MDASGFLDELQRSPSYRGQIVHVEPIPARAARYRELAEPLPPIVQQMLDAKGYGRLYTHQAQAVEAARRGEHMVIVTGTASGKTLCYTIPILESAVREPEATALYLFPTKALAQDQLRRLRGYQQLAEGLGVIATYDGDTARSTRAKVRDTASIILTNPDMLHVGILPTHPKWQRFLANLRYVVVDEVHAMRGIFGSHCAGLFRRLNRLCERCGSRPTYICCSATIANPREHAALLTERPMTLIDDDGAPRGPKQFVFWIIPQSATLKRLTELQRQWREADYGLGQALMLITAAFAHCYPLDVRWSEAPDAAQTLPHGFEPYASFIFDNYQGGMGYAEKAFAQIEDVLSATLSHIAACGCEDGCPLCVGFHLRPLIRHDPENTEGWIPDKEAALMVLHDVLGRPTYHPRPPSERLRTWRDRVRAAARPGPLTVRLTDESAQL